MADSYKLSVPGGVWTNVVDGPIEALITGTDNFQFAYAAEQPDLPGHFQQARQNLVARPNTGQALWAYNALRGFELTITTEPVV